MKNNKLLYWVKYLLGNRLFVIILSIIILVACLYISFVQIPLQIYVNKSTDKMLYKTDICSEIDDLNESYIENSDKIMNIVTTYVDSYAIQYDENSDLDELFKDCTERQKRWTSISMYIDEYMMGFEKWTDYRKNIEVSTLVSLYKNYLVEYSELRNLILERETIYVTISELESLLKEEDK